MKFVSLYRVEFYFKKNQVTFRKYIEKHDFALNVFMISFTS